MADGRALRAAILRHLYSLGEAAYEVGVHPDTLKRAERAGRIPTARRERTVDGYGDDRVYTSNDVAILRQLLAEARARSRSG